MTLSSGNKVRACAVVSEATRDWLNNYAESNGTTVTEILTNFVLELKRKEEAKQNENEAELQTIPSNYNPRQYCRWISPEEER